jgi:hypothetical protein
MKKGNEKNIGFEVLSENEENIVYKRVLTSNIPSKEKYKREMSLPKVTMHYFDIEDIEKLQRIQSQIAEKYVVKKEGDFIISLRAIKDFLLK